MREKVPGSPAPAHFSWSASRLKSVPVGERLKRCPFFLQSIAKEAIRFLKPIRIWVFGSRARGDHRVLSDYDLAFDVPKSHVDQWLAFSIEQKEATKTLLSQDWVLFSQAQPTLQKEIEQEGILIYEAKQ